MITYMNIHHEEKTFTCLRVAQLLCVNPLEPKLIVLVTCCYGYRESAAFGIIDDALYFAHSRGTFPAHIFTASSHFFFMVHHLLPFPSTSMAVT